MHAAAVLQTITGRPLRGTNPPTSEVETPVSLLAAPMSDSAISHTQQSAAVLSEARMSDSPRVTIMIATCNRIVELRKTLEMCRALTGPELEILVVDDASTDGTYELVRKEFPEIDVIRNEVNRGSIACRNDILRRARGDYIVALDDDSRFVDAGACARIVARMDAEPDLGIISFQIIGPEHPATLVQNGQVGGEWHCSSFACCGAAIRRSLLDRTGLFPEFFYHAYEEPDLALRTWDAGFRVLQWNEIVVYHEFSGLNRQEQRTHRRHARNEACSVVMRYPWPWVVPAVVAKLCSQARYAAHRGWLHREPRVWGEFLWRLPQALTNRQVVSSKAVKIAAGVNRARCVEAKDARRFGSLPWLSILRLPRTRSMRKLAPNAGAKSQSDLVGSTQPAHSVPDLDIN
jgi:GT2 family glycosyltransferase